MFARFTLLLLLVCALAHAEPVTAQSTEIARGMDQYRAGDYVASARILGGVIGADSSLVELYPALVASLFQLDRNAEAHTLAEAGLRRNPDHVLLNLLRADLLLADDDPEEALSVLSRIERRASTQGEEIFPEGVGRDEIRARIGRIHLLLGMQQGDANDWSGAAGHFRQARRWLSDDVQIHRSLAYAYVQTQQWDELLAASDQGLRRFPNDDGLRQIRLHALVEKGDAGAVVDETERLYRRNPADLDIGLSHAQALMANSRLADAQDVFGELFERFPNERRLYDSLLQLNRSMMNVPGMMDVLRRMQEAFPEDRNVPLQIAALHETRSDFEAARAVYDSLYVLRPDDSNLLLRIAATFEAEDHVDQAISVYEQILDQEPEHMEALDQLGALFEQTQQWVRARDQYEQLLELGSRDVHVPLGRVNEAIGDRQLAQRHFEMALDYSRRHPLPPLALGRIAKEDGDEDLAFAYAESALRLSLESVEREQRELMSRMGGQTGPSFDGLQGRRARATDELDYLDEIATDAFLFFSQAFSQERTEPVLRDLQDQYRGSGRLLYLVGRYYLAHEDQPAAIDHLERAVRAAPALREGHVVLAGLHEENGNLNQAILSWERALSLDESASDAYRALIRLSRETGGEDDLIRRWSARLRVDSDNATLRQYLIEALHKAGRDDEARDLIRP